MTDSSLNKDKIKELITKINITLRSKEQPSEEDIIILKNLFLDMKKPCFLLGLLSFYERTKQPSLISFVKENISIFENDLSLKVNQLYVVYYALTNQECDPKRMLLEENFFKKYKSIFTDWFQFSYFDSLLFNPILGEEFGENFLAINERKKIINFFSENEIEKDFLECYFLVSNEKYSLALSKLNLFLKKLKLFPKNLAYYLHSYNLISFCLFYNGYFIESITYLEMAGKLIQNDYFDKVIRLIKEGKDLWTYL
ncbi:hypothetical protein TUBRATIS_008020 [Tubulinosema ratisbonensis]|uniref:Uncharacterized protein n=1 Tax=Tubulinosema ratisbonensis TaxID=291195 RepID=A0A437AND5_9MICR|nr:hypothetical protein TUBRATIS_008020 [Tubulinosema ratisbonensis]